MEFKVFIFSILTVFVFTGFQDVLALHHEPGCVGTDVNDTININIAKIAAHDPFRIKSKTYGYRYGHFVTLTDIHLEGFSNIVATNINLEGVNSSIANVEMQAPLITGGIDSWYTSDDDFIFFGKGKASLQIKDVNIKAKATLNPDRCIETLDITPSIGNATVSITGLYYDQPISKKVSGVFNHILNDFINNSTTFHEDLSKFILDLIRKGW